MGCVVAKPSMNSPPRGLEKLKLENGYVKGGGFVGARRSTGQRPPPGKESGKTFQSDSTKNSSTGSYGSGGGREGKSVGGGGGGQEGKSVGGGPGGDGRGSNAENFARRFSTSKSSGADELVDGWPKWLTDNIPRDALAGLVPKSAESYDKLDKVSLLAWGTFFFFPLVSFE